MRAARRSGGCTATPPEVGEARVSACTMGLEENDMCTICFEDRPRVPLPCSCRMAYCAVCWDRALATSVLMCGMAQCPTCRSSFKVDFDSDQGSLTLRAAETGAAMQEWRTELYDKARPAQIRLLESFGADVAAEAGPSCVCGAPLERISSRDRVLRMLEDTDAEWRSKLSENSESLVDRLLDSCLVTCDLCECDATRSGAVWTCRKGPYTVLHPAAYDVCERCFAEHSGKPIIDGAARERSAHRHATPPGRPSAAASADGGPSRCCHPFVAALRSLLPCRFLGAHAMASSPGAAGSGGEAPPRTQVLGSRADPERPPARC